MSNFLAKSNKTRGLRLILRLDFTRSEIVKFYRIYPIVRALHGQLSWYHYLELSKIKNEKERSFYQNKTVINSWGYRELKKQIKTSLFQNTSKKNIEEVLRPSCQ